MSRDAEVQTISARKSENGVLDISLALSLYDYNEPAQVRQLNQSHVSLAISDMENSTVQHYLDKALYYKKQSDIIEAQQK